MTEQNIDLKNTGLGILATETPKKTFKVSTDAVDGCQHGFKVETKSYGGKDMLIVSVNEVGTKLLKVDLGQKEDLTDNAILAMLFLERMGADLLAKAAEWRSILTAKGFLQAEGTDVDAETDEVTAESVDEVSNTSETDEVAA